MGNYIWLLPKSHSDAITWATLIAKHKTFRLHSLITSPESFSSTYERESAFPDSVWEGRLSDPSAYTYVAMANSKQRPCVDCIPSSGSELGHVLEGEWVGSAVLVGPTTRESQEEHGDDKVFDVCGLFVLPAARGAGLGSELMQACTEHARRMASTMGTEKVRVRVYTACGNEKVVKLYQKLGFVEEAEKQAEAEVGPGVRTLVKEMDA